mgnify:CR=1 FL=1
MDYGITIEQWQKMYEQQKGLCPICLGPIPNFEDKHNKLAVAVDHDHKTKKVRGLTCWRCNQYCISNNTVETARRLVAYLEQDTDGRDL